MSYLSRRCREMQDEERRRKDLRFKVRILPEDRMHLLQDRPMPRNLLLEEIGRRIGGVGAASMMVNYRGRGA